MFRKAVTIFMLFALVLANKIPDFIKELAANARIRCIGETGIEEEVIENCEKGDFADDPSLKCYMKCILDGRFRKDGTIDEEALIAFFPPEYEAAFRKCAKLLGEDECETAFITNKCYYDNYPDLYFQV